MMLSYSPSSLLLCIFCANYAKPLELTDLQVPTQVPLGIGAVLHCQWTLGPNDVLYSVKWYKNGKEFFRYVPRNMEPIRTFLLPGVDVKKFNSSGSELILAPAVVATGGRYRCEVSGERPRFHTVSEFADMIIIVLPSDGLSILGCEPRYRVGDQVNVSCSTSQSQPGMTLTWYINGGNASSTSIPTLEFVEDNKTSNILGMKFIIDEKMGYNLKLQCLATTGSVFWRSIEKSVIVTKKVQNTENPYILKYSTGLAFSTNVKSGSKGMKQQYFYITTNFLFLYYIYSDASWV